MEKSRVLRNMRPASVSFGCSLLLVIAFAACTNEGKSGAPSREREAKSPTTASPGQAAATQQGADPGINLNCVYERLQNPPESFHYVYKKVPSDGFTVHQEGEFSPQAVEGFRLQPDGSRQLIRADRSDVQGWQSALAGLTGISGMAGAVSTFNHTSAMRRETDNGGLNGYQTLHYSIDTARWDPTEQQMLRNSTLGPGGFDKGEAWVTLEGCPVKLILDEEMHKKDGSMLDRVHYEEAMVKK